MRVSTEELLSIRDGEPVDVAAMQRLAADPLSQAELQRLHACRRALAELPAFDPPPDTWERIRAAHGAARPRRLRGGALVATGLAAVALAVLLADRLAPPAQETELVAVATLPDVGVDAAPAPSSAAGWRLAALLNESHQLERQLRDLEFRPRLASALTAGTVAQLEDRLLFIDHRLAAAGADGLSDEQLHALLEQRVELMNSLLAVRQAQAQRYTF